MPLPALKVGTHFYTTLIGWQVLVLRPCLGGQGLSVEAAEPRTSTRLAPSAFLTACSMRKSRGNRMQYNETS
jgi:hypothetical protein